MEVDQYSRCPPAPTGGELELRVDTGRDPVRIPARGVGVRREQSTRSSISTPPPLSSSSSSSQSSSSTSFPQLERSSRSPSVADEDEHAPDLCASPAAPEATAHQHQTPASASPVAGSAVAPAGSPATVAKPKSASPRGAKSTHVKPPYSYIALITMSILHVRFRSREPIIRREHIAYNL